MCSDVKDIAYTARSLKDLFDNPNFTRKLREHKDSLEIGFDTRETEDEL